jgi:2-keto-4-pentenoate hydratase/2-oxohepta-3-ene-1,7-dioic acid hydratase in catechol pathway
LQTRVNGETRQDDRTGRMLFPVARQIAYISTFTTLVPGDIIVTGTPTGAGARSDPPVFLKPGDVIEIEAEGIGTLRNGVVGRMTPETDRRSRRSLFLPRRKDGHADRLLSLAIRT